MNWFVYDFTKHAMYQNIARLLTSALSVFCNVKKLRLSYFMWQSYLGSTKQSEPTHELGIWSSDPFHVIYFCDLKMRIWTWKSAKKNVPFRRPRPQRGLLSQVEFRLVQFETMMILSSLWLLLILLFTKSLIKKLLSGQFTHNRSFPLVLQCTLAWKTLLMIWNWWLA